MDERQEIRILASRLAKRYNSGKDIGPCACVGLLCGEVGCSIWWAQFLELFKAEDIAKMVEAYIVVAGYPQFNKQDLAK